MKHNKNYLALIDLYKVERSIIRHQLSQKNLFTYYEFETLSKNIELDIKTILILYFGEENENIAEKYYEALLKNQKLYLGNMSFTSTKNESKIIEFCQNYAKAVCIILNCKEIIDEITSEAIAYSWENMGSYELNFSDDWLSVFKPYMVGIMKNWCRIYKTNQTKSLNKQIYDDSYTEKQDIIATYDEYTNIELESNNNLYSIVLKLLSNGYDFNDIITYLTNKTNISADIITEKLKAYILDNSLIKTDTQGRISLKK